MKPVRSGENVVSTRKVRGWRGKWKLNGEEAFRRTLLPDSPEFVQGCFVFRPLQNLAPLYIDLDLEFLEKPDDHTETSKKLMYLMAVVAKAWYQVTGDDQEVDIYCFQRPAPYKKEKRDDLARRSSHLPEPADHSKRVPPGARHNTRRTEPPEDVWDVQ